MSPYAPDFDEAFDDDHEDAATPDPSPSPSGALVPGGAAPADLGGLFGGSIGLSEPEIHARVECERRKAGLEAAVIKAVDKLSRSRARVLHQVEIEVAYRLRRRRAQRDAARARAQFERRRLVDGQVRQLPTWALVAGTAIGTGLEWFVDQGALEGLLYLPSMTTKVIALVPVVISVTTAHLYGKYAKRRHLAPDDLLIGASEIRFGRAMAAVGLAAAVVIGTIRGLLGGPLSGLLFLVASIGLWLAIAYMAYLWESPDESHLKGCERRVRHLDRMIQSTARRKRRHHRRYLTERRTARSAAAGLIETVRHIFRVSFHHFAEPLDDVAIPEWVKQWFPIADDHLPPSLDITPDQLDPPLPPHDDDTATSPQDPPTDPPELAA